MLPEIIASTALVPMIFYVLKYNRVLGALGWVIFATASLIKGFEFLNSADYYNSILFLISGLFFLILSKSVISSRSRVMVEVTSFSVLSCAIYFPFVFFEFLNTFIIEKTAYLSSQLGNVLGFPIIVEGRVLELNESYVEIILPCTAIESISLFTGATLGIKAESSRKIKAFLISVPVIYFLNLLRNLFVLLSFSYSWFGENSFYIAHNLISKILATFALIIITYVVFRVLPELAELIYSLKNEILKGVRID
ncbi:MAG: archaeosortase A [Archaeoglobaceae archaeon]|nr:archaeosortase A [Archaeoglobaceae archaeon]MDW7989180.1 archaeosortase A [Archaeoglobaceae archaeon]